MAWEAGSPGLSLAQNQCVRVVSSAESLRAMHSDAEVVPFFQAVRIDSLTSIAARLIRSREPRGPLPDDDSLPPALTEPLRRAAADSLLALGIATTLASVMKGHSNGFSEDQAVVAVLFYRNLQLPEMPALSVLADPLSESASKIRSLLALQGRPTTGAMLVAAGAALCWLDRRVASVSQLFPYLKQSGTFLSPDESQLANLLMLKLGNAPQTGRSASGLREFLCEDGPLAQWIRRAAPSYW
jgi:hypothetical protein